MFESKDYGIYVYGYTQDLEKITKTTKYINIDITNCNHDVIAYFIQNGKNYLYSETIDENKGYIYVSYEDFYKAENIITSIYLDMPNDLTKLETARYLYTKLSKYVFFDINIIPEKNENYNFSLTNNIGKKPCVAPQVILSNTPMS